MKNYFRNIFRAITGRTQPKAQQRSYLDVIGRSGAYSDWAFSFISEDGDLRNNANMMRDRSRDLFKTDPYFRKWKEELFANVFGENGLRLRMKVKETGDRTVYAADEKSFLVSHNKKMDKVRGFAERRAGAVPISFLRGKATIEAGDIDLYACTLIERAYAEWQRKEFCTMAGNLTYNEVRQLRLLSCARDGDFFLRMIRGQQAGNKFGFSLQLINSEWCDFNLNVTKLDNGNSIRMGVELNQWGKRVAYHFIKRSAWDWQFTTPGLVSGSMGGHERILAEDVIHYARLEYADSTRGAPWAAAVIKLSRQLAKFEEAEVIAARVAACKMGFLESTLNPDGGNFVTPDPCVKPPQWDQTPGGIQGLPYGVTFKEWNPNHPAQNFESFRKGVVRGMCAGMPGADYNVIANDLENINFSAGRLGRLDTNELNKLIQRFDIDTAERPIFEAWLEMALASGAIPLPLAKFEKYNQPHFSGRRWAGVDPIKETQAAVLAIQNKLMSYTRWYDDQGWDLEEEWMQIAEEQMLAEELGIVLPVDPGALPPDHPSLQDDDEEDKPKKKPKEEKANGHGPRSTVAAAN